MSKEKILIVEDEFIIAEALKENLESLGYDVMDVLGSGKNAIDIINNDRPDIILMDIKINGELDGIETAENILRIYDIPILYQSSYDNSELIKRAQETSPYGYVSKSIPINELHTNIQIILTKSRNDRKIKHLNKFLKAIRNIHKIIITETIKENLLSKICQFFVETQDYSSSYIALINEGNKLTDFFEFGSDKEPKQVKELLNNAKMTKCIEYALNKSDAIFIKNTNSYCADCPLLEKSSDTKTMTVGLKHNEINYGIMSVKFDQNLDIDDEEQILFKEVADDIAFALHKISIEEEKEKTTEALKLSKEQFQIQSQTLNTIFDSAPYILVLINSDGQVENINHKGIQFSGKNKNKLLGHLGGEVLNCFNSFDGKGCGRNEKCSICPLRIKIESSMSTGKHYIDEECKMDFILNNQKITMDLLISTIPVNINNLKMVLLSIADNTERKRAEDEISRSQKMLNDVINTIPVRVFWKDTKGVYLGCNQLFANDAGREKPDDVKGFDDYDMPWTQQAEAYRIDDRHVMNSGESKINYEENQTTPEGKIIWVNTSKIPLRNKNNEIIGVLGTYEDITERKIARQEHQKRYDQLKTFNQLSVDRELKMVELKKEINLLYKLDGKKSRYTLPGDIKNEEVK